MDKFLTFIFGFCVITGLILLGLYLRWSGGADEQKAWVLANISHFEQQFTSNTAKVQFQYDSIEVLGFPFSHYVRFYQPALNLRVGAEHFYIALNRMDMMPDGDEQQRYQLEISNEMTVGYKSTGNVQESYRLHVSGLPKLWLQAAEGPAPAHWSEYGVAFTGSLTLDVTNDQKSEKIGFNPMATPIPIWRKIPAHIHYPAQLFVGMLREAMVYR